MSTSVLMKILESAPERYDAGIWLLSLGAVARCYDRLARDIHPGQCVLDVGCGTGALAIRAAGRGAAVKAFDVNPHMLAIARRRAEQAGLAERIAFVEQGVAELDAEPDESYDVVTAGLCFSELTSDELRFTLQHVARILKPAGLLLAADEVLPANFAARTFHRIVRIPLALMTYLITQQTTRPVRKLPERLRDAGLEIVRAQSSGAGSFREFVARKPQRGE